MDGSVSRRRRRRHHVGQDGAVRRRWRRARPTLESRSRPRVPRRAWSSRRRKTGCRRRSQAWRERSTASPDGAVAAVGLVSQVNTHVFVDAEGEALAPAIVWQDGRCAEDAARLDRLVAEEARLKWWGAPAADRRQPRLEPDGVDGARASRHLAAHALGHGAEGLLPLQAHRRSLRRPDLFVRRRRFLACAISAS